MAYDDDYEKKAYLDKKVLNEDCAWYSDGIDFSVNNRPSSSISQEAFDELMCTLGNLALSEQNERLAVMFFDCKQIFEKSISHIDGMEEVEKELWTLATGNVVSNVLGSKKM